MKFFFKWLFGFRERFIFQHLDGGLKHTVWAVDEKHAWSIMRSAIIRAAFGDWALSYDLEVLNGLMSRIRIVKPPIEQPEKAQP